MSANEVVERLTGYSLTELEQKSIWKLVNKDSVEQVINHFEQAIKGNSLVTEIKGIRKDGRVIVLSIKDIPFIINGEIKGFFLIIRDITEKKKNEDYMRKSEKLSVVGELASSVAHEIRNPLTSIKGFLQLLRRDERIKDQFYIDIMLSEIDRINLIVSEFMILAKPHMTNYYVRDIKGLVVNVITLLQTIAIIKNIEIVTEFDTEVANINCEENQIKQVFINILKNAIEAEKDGGKIKVKIKKDSKNERVIIRFIDSGAGIPKERLPKLGEPFYTTKDKGTGLGLMVSYKIIQEHNGDIKIKSKEQRGTIVDVSFPLAE